MRHLNPDGLHKHPGYSQAVAVTGEVTTVYVGGQNSVNAAGEVIGPGDLGAQTRQALRNVETALAAAGARLEHVVRWSVHVVQGQSAVHGFEAFRDVWGSRPNPPAVTVTFVAALARPEYLVEIDAIAVVPRE